MLTTLQHLNFKVPSHIWMTGHELTDMSLSNCLATMRIESEYEIDGLVIDVNLATKRVEMNPTKSTLNPAYAVKYKIAQESNYAEAKVVGIEFNISKHGYVKPTIVIEPTKLVGVTITRCTGFNMKFIKDNMIQLGCVIKLQRAGDVIPFCMGVVKLGSIEDLEL